MRYVLQEKYLESHFPRHCRGDKPLMFLKLLIVQQYMPGKSQAIFKKESDRFKKFQSREHNLQRL